ncbi:MAG TPA: Re/Si-specific NAD(P)(+) transhydrogenase subunit alpha [Bryobacteraceae bacterium]|nr:Re/Si-specific NAD(P)(+) transhydrogenase subunit alpha [Bryobacteraceae bacterium]
MGLSAGVVKETCPGERRVAVTPKVVDMLTKAGVGVWIESGAGVESGYPDEEYAARGAKVASLADIRASAGVLLTVHAPEPIGLNKGQVVIGFCDPLSEPDIAARYAQAGLTLFSMELVPRITRAQSMDALSSMASIAGYKAVLLAAVELPRLFPMMTTAAGTLPPARVLVIGAGVAGLQAIATARRLGAVVSGYDVRAAVKEQIESLGAKFVSIDIGTTGEGQGGYARALTEEEIRSQREQMAKAIEEQDVVITTAAVPGRKAPILVTREMALGMSPGSVIVDIAAERGGNCELTSPGETVVENGVRILGPVNLPSTVPGHASQMYARNIVTLLKNMLTKTGELNIDTSDEITRESMVVRDGEVVNPRVQALLGAAVKS